MRHEDVLPWIIACAVLAALAVCAVAQLAGWISDAIR